MKRFLFLITILFLVSLSHTVFFLSPWGQMLENKFLDLFFNIRGSLPSPRNVVIVAMDEDSYGNLGISPNQPWPRILHAKLIRRLKELGARRAVFDVLFLGSGSDAKADIELARAITSIPTVLGADYGTIEEHLYQKEGLILPLTEFRRQAEQVALVGLPEDNGFIRRFLIDNSLLKANLPSLALAAIGPEHQSLQGPGSYDFINYYGPPRSIPTFSYDQVLDTTHSLPPDIFGNKIVFIGLSLRTALGPAQKDAYLTPFSKNGRMFGVEIHATACENIFSKNWIQRYPVWIESLVLCLVTFIMAFFLFKIKPIGGFLLLFGYGLSWGFVSYLGFLKTLYLPGAILAVVILPFSYLGSTLYFYAITRREQIQIERAFKFYLSPEMAHQIARNPAALRLGGEKVYATAMFTDIESFTSIAESMEPEEVGRMLNAYFSEVMNVIFESKGTLIKFIGDAVFAIWGSPIKTPDHARLACESSMHIQQEIERFNKQNLFPALKTRIGIHTGHMVIGNLGSKKRFDFTAIGDAVNLASRIEGVNKYLGTSILITESVQNNLRTPFSALPIGAIQVAGKREIVPLFTLLIHPLQSDLIALWTDALRSFSNQQWEESEEKFNDFSIKTTQLKSTAEFYLNQIIQFRKQSPPANWQGEIIFSSK